MVTVGWIPSSHNFFVTAGLSSCSFFFYHDLTASVGGTPPLLSHLVKCSTTTRLRNRSRREHIKSCFIVFNVVIFNSIGLQQQQ